MADPAFAIGHLRQVEVGPEIVAYLERIDATLAPFGGVFRVHGAQAQVLEGAWAGDLIVIEFPDREHASNWYASEAYQQILPLRRSRSTGDVFLIDGVPREHRATDVLIAG